MLFAFIYRVRPTLDDGARRRLRRLFIAWEPPEGVDIKCHYAYARGGGLAIAEAANPAMIWQSLVPFSPWVEIEVEPVLSIVEALAISSDGDEAPPAGRHRKAS